MMGMGQNPRNIQKNEYGKQRKEFPVWLSPIPPSTKWRPTVFQCPKTPKTSWTYPWLDRGPSLVGQEIQGWARYGQLKAGNMTFIHVNFQDLQQKPAGVRVKVQK